ncbi:glycosyltransferase family 4 protein [Rickettsia canadensis]|uniref:Glycosyltransferase n=1 Tax=Rickettsia canadensis str. CA410 TaxID=1105107 RepID=A0ABM5MUA8_RICCA|nr:glycosyltransferase family 4 protein [Rickettsia canadensis]AFB21245.1 glycosyltransferase [Rickettsia canadensis str. CA410]
MPSLKSSKKYNKYTILQVVPALVSGGVERGTIEVAKYLKIFGHTPIIISAGGTLVKELDKEDILHIQMNSSSKNPFVILNNARLIAEIIKKYNVDIVHTRSRAPAWSSYLATKWTNAKFLTTFHGVYNIPNSFKKYYNSIMLKGEKVIAVSNFVKQHLLENYKVDEGTIVVIDRGVNCDYFDPANLTPEKLKKCRDKYDAPSNLPIILMPSRMTSWKGHLVLVEALSKLKHRDFYCLMVGDISRHPSFTNRVKELIANLKLQNKIQIFGNDSDIINLYGISDIIVSPSIEPEAFGRTIIEGQAMQKLVIATNIGGAVETINNNITGFHVEHNNADALSQKIDYCFSILGTDTAKKIQEAARYTVINNFSLDLMLRKNLEVYKAILKNSHIIN